MPAENDQLAAADRGASAGRSAAADGLIEIHDPEVDLGDIMAQIRRRIEERRAALGVDRRVFPSYGGAGYPGEPEDIPYDTTLYHHLRLANELYAEVETAPLLAASPSTRVPVLGRLWGLIRGQMHGLVLFYVNRAVSRQVNVDRHLVSTLNRLTGQVEAQQRELAALRARLDAAGAADDR